MHIKTSAHYCSGTKYRFTIERKTIMKVGERIAALREQKNLSVNKLAEFINSIND